VTKFGDQPVVISTFSIDDLRKSENPNVYITAAARLDISV